VKLPAPGDGDAFVVAIVERGASARRLLRVVDDATATPIYINYHLGPEWFEGVEDALDALDGHLVTDPTAVLLLAEHLIHRLEDAAIDDSDGWLTQAVPRTERLHAAACERLAIEPRILADRLHGLAAASEIEAF